jgi:antitoxin PrlF
MMAIAKLTTKGQITIPKEVQDYLKIEPGSQVEFVMDDTGCVKLMPLKVPVEALAGILHQPGMPAATLDQMEAAIQEGSRDWT